MTFSDSDLLPLSALQHYIFCPRQCGLIHIEQQWVENRFTAEGRAMHERVDRPEHEIRDGIRCEFAVPIRSLELGLIGKADLIEFYLPGHTEGEKVVPVEYKRGRPKPDHCDWVQLCAQALCLEEMLGIRIESGAIFYGQPRRRQQVPISPELREETRRAAENLHRLIDSGKTPPPQYDKKRCSACSLMDICLPQVRRSAETYLQNSLASLEDTSGLQQP